MPADISRVIQEQIGKAIGEAVAKPTDKAFTAMTAKLTKQLGDIEEAYQKMGKNIKKVFEKTFEAKGSPVSKKGLDGVKQFVELLEGASKAAKDFEKAMPGGEVLDQLADRMEGLRKKIAKLEKSGWDSDKQAQALAEEELKRLDLISDKFGELDDKAKEFFDRILKSGGGAAFDKLVAEFKKAFPEIKKGFDKLGQEAEEAMGNLAGEAVVREIDSKMNKIKLSINALAKAENKASKIHRQHLKSNLVLLEKAKKAVKSLTVAQKEQLAQVVETGSLGNVLETLKDFSGDFAGALKDALSGGVGGGLDEKLRDIEKSGRKKGGRFDDEAKKFKIFSGSFKESADEAEEFNKTLGMTGGKVTALGVALIFTAKKLGEASNEIRDQTLMWAKYRTELASTARIAIVPGGADQLEEIRKSLGMTTSQFSNFTDMVRDGSNIGIISLDKLAKSASALRDVFGGDQTKRLQEYVDLLKEFPTLDADLSVTASMDDQTATLFALAQKGKIPTVLDLRAAGLAGGPKIEGTADTKILNSSQQIERWLEQIEMDINSFYKEAVPIMSGLSKFGSGIFSKIGYLVGLAGAYKVLFGVNTAKTIAAMEIQTDKLIGAMYASAGRGEALGRLQGKTTGGAALGSGIASRIGLTAIAIGVAGGALAAPIVVPAIVEFLEPAGDAARSFGEFVVRASQDVSSYSSVLGKYVEQEGKAISWFGDWVSMFGKFGQRGIKEIERMFGAGPGAEQVSDKQMKSIKDQLNLNTKRMRQEKALQKNALALQKAHNLIRVAADNAKTSLGQLQKEVAGLKIDQMARMGGTSAEFNKAIKDSIDGTVQSFRVLNKDLKDARRFILSDASMTASARRAALEELHKEELVAQKEFLDGLRDSMGNFSKLPKVVAAGLEIAMRDLRMSIRNEAMGGFTSNLPDLIDNLSDSFDALDSTTGNLKTQMDMNTEAYKKFIEEVSPEEVGKQIKAMPKQAAASVNKLITEGVIGKGAEGRVTVLKKTEGEKFRKEQEAGLTELQKKSEDLGSAIPFNPEELDAMSGEVESRLSAMDSLNKEFAGLQDKIIASTKGTKEEADIYVEQARISKQILETENEVNDFRKKIADRKQQMAEAGGRQAIETLIVQKNQIDDQINNRKVTLDLYDKIAGFDNNIVGAQERNNKIISDYADEVKKTIATLNRIADAVEGDPTVKMLKVRQRRAEVELGLGMTIGNYSGKFVDSQMARLETLKQEEKLTRDSIEAVERMTKDGGKISEHLNTVGKQFDDTREQMVKVFQIEGLGDISGLSKDMGDSWKSLQEAIKKDAEKPTKETKAAVTRLYGVYSEAAQKFNEKVNETQRTAKQAGKTSAAASLKGYSDSLKTLDSQMSALAGDSKAVLETLNANLAIFEQEIVQLGRGFDDLIAGFDQIPVVALAKEQSALSDTMLDLTNVSLDAGKSFDYAARSIQAAKSEFTEAGKIADEMAGKINKQEELVRAALKQEAALRSQGKVTEADQMRGKIAQDVNNIEIERLKRANWLAQAELKYKKQVVDAAKKARDIQISILDAQKSVIDEQTAFLSDIGASFSSIFSKMREGLQIESEKIAIQKQALAMQVEQGDLVEGTVEYEQQVANIRKAEIGLQRQVIGAQRDAMEKLLGKAFGALSGTGAKRYMMSEQRLLGVAGTRFQTTAGRLRGLGKGEGGTLEARSAKFGMATAFQGAAGTIGGAATRTSFEKEMEKQLAGGADPQKITAKNTAIQLDVQQKQLDEQKETNRLLGGKGAGATPTTGGAKGAVDDRTRWLAAHGNKAAQIGLGMGTKSPAGLPVSDDYQKMGKPQKEDWSNRVGKVMKAIAGASGVATPVGGGAGGAGFGFGQGAPLTQMPSPIGLAQTPAEMSPAGGVSGAGADVGVNVSGEVTIDRQYLEGQIEVIAKRVATKLSKDPAYLRNLKQSGNMVDTGGTATGGGA